MISDPFDRIAARDSLVDGPAGQVANASLVGHTERLERKLYEVRTGVWCLVGNGLSNQTFVEGPEGIIAIDTGESVQEMEAALVELRRHTATEIVAVVYTHFHYVDGTAAIVSEDAEIDLEIWGHERIVANRARVGTEISAAAQRGLVEQFGIFLPDQGPDAVVNVGLGLSYRDPRHAPFAAGFVPPNREIVSPMTTEIAGLTVEFHPAPSDADDNVTIWFPSLGVCVNNLVWPALFNVFAIRGEEYRDPRLLLKGLDHVASLAAEHLVGAHGPPLSGAVQIAAEVEMYRDSIQFLWDQAVRAINQGRTSTEVGAGVVLPEVLADSYLTQQHYGLAEHHARQIFAGLRGWFDGDPANLLPLQPVDHANRMVQGFGGIDEVRRQFDTAIDEGDLRWAIELATWLHRADEGDDADSSRLASALRAVGQSTTSANVRNWTLTRARELDGDLDLSRFRVHRFTRGMVLGTDPELVIHGLRVVVDPDRAAGLNVHVGFEVDGARAGLHLRHHVAVPTSGEGAEIVVQLDHETLAEVLSGRTELGAAVAGGTAHVDGDLDRLSAFCQAFDLDGLVV